MVKRESNLCGMECMGQKQGFTEDKRYLARRDMFETGIHQEVTLGKPTQLVQLFQDFNSRRLVFTDLFPRETYLENSILKNYQLNLFISLMEIKCGNTQELRYFHSQVLLSSIELSLVHSLKTTVQAKTYNRTPFFQCAKNLHVILEEIPYSYHPFFLLSEEN